MPGASELPSFVAVEITKECRSLPALFREGKPTAVDGAPSRSGERRRGLIEIDWGGRRFALIVMSTPRAGAVLDVLARR